MDGGCGWEAVDGGCGWGAVAVDGGGEVGNSFHLLLVTLLK